MKFNRCIPFLFLLLMAACTQLEDAFLSEPDNLGDVAYSRLLDSVEYALDYTLYTDFDVTTIQPVMEHYQSDSTQFGFWMQARCHHLLGRLGFFSDYYSEEVAQHYVDALTLLDEHFSTAQPQVCILYGKTFRMMSRLISNFKDEALCKQLGKLAL